MVAWPILQRRRFTDSPRDNIGFALSRQHAIRQGWLDFQRRKSYFQKKLAPKQSTASVDDLQAKPGTGYFLKAVLLLPLLVQHHPVDLWRFGV